MQVADLLAVLATSGLSDDDYARVATTVRSLAAQATAGRALAESVLENESYQPASVMRFVGPVYTSALADVA